VRRFAIILLLLVTACAQPLTTTAVDSQLPGMLGGQYAWNGTSFAQNLWTHENTQYAVWVDDQRHPIIGKRVLPDGEWATFDLATVPNNPLASPVELDNHNVVSVGVDPSGHIHVAGNMHGPYPIRYVRSTQPGDITSWEAPGMVGNESNVTYPQFVLTGDELLFFYRRGSSTKSHVYVNALESGSWVQRAHLFNGIATNEGPYINRVAVADDGTLHVMMMWRNTNLAGTSDLSYARSSDAGRTWTDSEGSAYVLPITHTTVEVAVDTPSTGFGLLNQSGLAVDGSGHPHGAFLYDDYRGATQVHHVWHDGHVWHQEQLTTLVLDLDFADRLVSRPSVFYDGTSVWVLYWAGDGDKPLRAINVTTGAEIVVLGGGFGDWEPTYDPHAPAGELVMLVTEVSADGTGPTATPGRVFSVVLGDL